MSDTRNVTSTIHLRFGDERQIVVEPEDQDRFVLSVEEAVKACRIYEVAKAARFGDQFRALLDRLGEWLSRNRDLVTTGVLTTRDAGLLFLVASEGTAFNDELEERLTDLDIEVARNEDLELIRLSVLAIPDDHPESLNCFADPETTWTYGLGSESALSEGK